MPWLVTQLAPITILKPFSQICAKIFPMHFICICYDCERSLRHKTVVSYIVQDENGELNAWESE